MVSAVRRAESIRTKRLSSAAGRADGGRAPRPRRGVIRVPAPAPCLRVSRIVPQLFLCQGVVSNLTVDPASKSMPRIAPEVQTTAPYPKELERYDVLRDGTRIFVRPLRPEDAALYPSFFRDVTREDMRLRFFAPMREISPELIDKLTHLDYAQAMAFVALDDKDGKLLGVVRLHYDPDEKGGEYAILVRSGLKGMGLGWDLMQRIIEYATAQGLERIHGQVLSENVTMLQMCGELGFHIADDPDSPGVKEVTLQLQPRPKPS
jgi:acetyltransferase